MKEQELLDRIRGLEAEVAGLHLFVISLIDALPADITAPASHEFLSNFEALRGALAAQGRSASANKLQNAVEAINGRSVAHLYR